MSRSSRSAELRSRALPGGALGRPPARAGRWPLPDRRAWPPLLIGLLLAGLALAALRVDGIRVRYALASALAEEDALREERNGLLAEVRRLRDPVRLAREAEALGLARPERVLELPPRTEPTGPAEQP